MSKNILRDFDVGGKGEKMLLDYLKSIKLECGKNTKDDKGDYDLWAKWDGFTWTFECKADLYSLRSGNLAIEWYNSKSCKPSGITSTKADFWVFTFGHITEGVWMAKVKTLHEYIDKHKPKRMIYSGGDGNADLKLYDKETLLKACFVEISKLTQLMFIRHSYEG